MLRMVLTIIWLPIGCLAGVLEKDLVRAIENGNLIHARQLVEKGADVDYRPSRRENLLMVAAKQGDETLVDLLIEAGADLHFSGKKGNAVTSAAAWGRYRAAQHLLVRGAKVDVPDKDGKTPLMYATYRNDHAMMRLLLRMGADPDHCDKNARGSLHIAAGMGSEESVGILMMAGARTEIKNREGQTPLSVAHLQGHAAVQKRLLAYGADPLVRNKTDAEVLNLAELWAGTYQPIARPAKRPTLAWLASKAFPDMTVAQARGVLDSGVGIDQPNDRGETPLIRMVVNGNLPVADFLLEKGADPEAPDRLGATPLMTAVSHGRLALALRLLRAGANPNRVADPGFTALYLAGQREDRPMTGVLLRSGAKKIAVLYDLVHHDLKAIEGYKDLQKMISSLPTLTSETHIRTTMGPGTETGPIYHESEPGVTPPVILSQGLLAWPMESKGKMGPVLLEAVFGKDGRIWDVKVLEGLGDGQYGFEAGAVITLTRWKFKPGEVNGVPVHVRQQVEIDFTFDLPKKFTLPKMAE